MELAVLGAAAGACVSLIAAVLSVRSRASATSLDFGLWKRSVAVSLAATVVAIGLLTLTLTILVVSNDEIADDLPAMVSSNVELNAVHDRILTSTAMLAPQQPLPDSYDPLKVKAVEAFNAGAEAYNEGKIGQALGHWLTAVNLDPGYARAHNNIGLALATAGDLDAAIQHYDSALRIDPDFTAVHNNLGNALRDMGDLDAAIEHYIEALQIDPDAAAAHANIGVALAMKGDLDAAIEHFDAALRIGLYTAAAHTDIAAAHTKLVKQLAQSLATWQASCKASDNGADYD